jgi:8-oxo-dGTP diphosphatase
MSTAHQREPRAVANASVAVRIIAFAVEQDGLQVALLAAADMATLPAGQLRGDETLTECAARVARHALAVEPDYLEQLYTFSAPGPRAEVVVAYYAMLSTETRRSAQRAAGVYFAQVDGEIALPRDERAMLDYAATRLRAKLGYSNIAFYFLPRQFTLSELQDIYESVIGRALDKRNFRRRILASGIVEALGAKRAGTGYRPATLYRFVGEDPATGTLTPSETEWSA